MKHLVVGILLLAAVFPAAGQKTAFSSDSAYANLRSIVEEFGPRPMGSPAEQKALAFAVEKFKSSGCDTAFLMPMLDASGVITTSGIAVGVHKGKSGRIILIGGHMDSSGPDIPGVNDDGSGSASVIELSRVLAKRPTESTIIFCCWGGEERGLEGSKYFVEHFARVDSIALMLQLDMTDGAGILQLDPDAGAQVSAPRWLVEAALDIFYNDLGHKGLVYETQSSTINATAGGTGSDHIPFLEKGIPSLDFTSDVDYPIHSPLDNLQNFNPSGFARAGDLVLKLVERFDAGVPSRATEKYWLAQFGAVAIFVSHLQIWVFVTLSFAAGIVAFFVARKNRLKVDPAEKVRWSGLKIVLFTLLSQSLVWLAGDLVAVVRGIRFPWVNNFSSFVILGVLLGLLGGWLGIMLTKRLRLTRDIHAYAMRALIPLALLTALLSWASVELGLYGAASLLCVALALLIRPAALRYVFVLAAPVPIIRMVFFEELGLILRSLTSRPGDVWWGELALFAGLVVFFTLISLPFLYAFAAVYRSSASRFLSLPQARRIEVPGAIAAAAVFLIAFLVSRPVYSPSWEPDIKVVQRCTYGADSSVITMISGERLKGTRLHFAGKDSVLDAATSWTLKGRDVPPVSWCTLEAQMTPDENPPDSLRKFTRTLRIHSAIRPLGVTVSYRSSAPFTLTSPLPTKKRTMGGGGATGKSFEWYSFPDTLLTLPVTFAVSDSQKVTESVEVTYARLAFPIDVSKEQTITTKRTIVRREVSFIAPRTKAEFAERGE